MGTTIASSIQQQQQTTGVNVETLVSLLTTLTRVQQQNQPPPPVAPPTHRLHFSQRWNILGWSQLPPDAPLPDFWQKFDESKSSKAVEIVITTDLFSRLREREPSFDRTVLNKTLITTIGDLTFVPTGKHLGLGPLATAFRNSMEIQRLDATYQLLQASTTTSLSDNQRTKLNTPIPPYTPEALSFVIRRHSCLLATLFTDSCPLVQALDGVYKSLCTKQGAYNENLTSFAQYTAPAILHELTKATSEFFESCPTEESVTLGIYPEVSFAWLLQHLAAGRSLSDYMNIPDMFYHPTHQKYSQQLPPHPTSIAPLPQLPTTIATKSPQALRINAQHPEPLATAFRDWSTQHPHSAIPRIADAVLDPLKIDREELTDKCNLTADDCIRYALWGSCSGPCNYKHTTQATPATEFMTSLCDTIRNMLPYKRRRFD
jgi:hypothetical protein